MRWFGAFGLALLLAACDETPPPAPQFDASLRLDGGVQSDGSVPRDATVRGPNPQFPPADIEIVLPYMGDEVRIERELNAASGKLDLVFNIDTTGSLAGEITTLQQELSDRIIPMVEDRVNDVAFGVSHFEDFPIAPFGAAGDVAFELLTEVTDRRTRLAGAVQALGSLGNGGDAPESGFEALYQVATGEGLRQNGVTYIDAYRGDGLGGAGFRPSALHVVLHATDAPSHSQPEYAAALPDAHSLGDVTRALNAIDAKVIGVVSSDSARISLLPVVEQTGAVVPAVDGRCRTGIAGETRPPDVAGGCALLFDIGPDGEGLSDAIVQGIIDLLDAIAYGEVYGEARDDPFELVRAVIAKSARADERPPERADLRPEDGLDDTFLGVRFGTELTFELVFQNRTLPGADYDQVFRIFVDILGDGQLLDTLAVRVTVPAMRVRIDAGMPDAGSDAGVDAGMDAGSDAGMDAGTDAGNDAGADSGADAGS